MSAFYNEDKITQTVDLTCDTKIKHEELVSNYTENCSKLSILQKYMMQSNSLITQLLDKRQTSPSNTNIILDKPAPKYKKILLKKFEAEADIDKKSDKPIEAYNIPNAPSPVELCSLSNRPKLENSLVVNESELNLLYIPLDLSSNTSKLTSSKVGNEKSEINMVNILNESTSIELSSLSDRPELGSTGVVKEISKIEVILRTREEKKKIISSPPLNYNNRYKELYANGINLTRHRLPIEQQSAMDRLRFVDNLSYKRYNRPSISQCLSGQQNIYENHMNYSFTPHFTFDRPPPSHYPYHIQPICHCSIRDTNNTDNMNSIISLDTKNNLELKRMETKTTHSYSSNSIRSQGIISEAQNDIKVDTEAEMKKTVYSERSNSLKRSYVRDENINNITNQKPEHLTKRNKLGESSKFQSQHTSRKVEAHGTNTGYSPPILPIPSYDTIFSLLRLKNVIYVKTRYWRMSDEVADSPQYVETDNTLNEHRSDTEENAIRNKENKVKKISLEEYKRRKIKEISLLYEKNGQ